MILSDRLAVIAEGFAAVDSWYVDGALAELDQDESLREQFRLTMEALNAAPTEPELRQALEAHLGVVAECVVRHGRKEGLCEHVPWDLVAWYLENPEVQCARCELEGRPRKKSVARERQGFWGVDNEKEEKRKAERAVKMQGLRGRLRNK